MYDEEKMKVLQLVFMIVNTFLMAITVFLQITAFETVRHTIMCSCILLLVTVTLVFDGILKDSKGIIRHSIWYVLWISNLIINLLK